MGAIDEGAAPAGLLRQYPARRDGRRLARALRHLLRYDRWTSVRICERRGRLGTDRAKFSGGVVGGSPGITMIRVVLPAHLRTLARVNGEVTVKVEGPVTQRSVLDALEARYPMLRGTIRDHGTLKRRAFVRFFACEQDLSNEEPDTLLPDAIALGAEPFWVVAAIAGG